MVSMREWRPAVASVVLMGLLFGCRSKPDVDVVPVQSALTNQSGVAGGQCGFVEQLANGDMLFAIKFPVTQAYVEVFSKQNGVQNIAKALAGDKNADGSFTYRTIVPAATYKSGDKILARFYSYAPNQPGVFTPGLTDSTFLPQFVYSSAACAENVACSGFLQSPTYVQQVASGNLQFSVTLPTGQQYVEAFVEQNDVQTIAQNIVSSGVANADGTKTYSLVSPASKYKSGDRVLARFYSYLPKAPGVFTPGSTDNVWTPLFVYNKSNTCDVQCSQQTCSGHGDCAIGGTPGQIVCNCTTGFQGPSCSTLGRRDAGVDSGLGGSAAGVGGGSNAGADGGGAGSAAGASGGAPVDGGADALSSGGSCAASPSTVWGGPQPGPVAVTSIWSIARNDVLAFGAELSHWDGTSWNAFSPQPPFQNGPASAGVVTASGDDDIWFQQFGLLDTFPVTRWNGTTWLDVSPTFPSGTNWTPIWLAGPNDAWLAVQLPTPVTPDLNEIPQPALYHWTGSAWTQTPSPLDSVVGGAVVGPIWGSSPNDVWLFVGGATPGFIHWDGHAWTTADDTLSGAVFSLWGSSATDIWAGGWSKSDQGVMWHFDGTSWSEVDFAIRGIFEGMWGSCSGDFWASLESETGNPAELWHYNGSAWSIFDLGSSQPGLMTGTSPDDIWMTVPNSSTLRHRQPGFCGDGAIGPGEQCDPPHQGPDGPQCGSNCQLLTCGNGVIDPGEQCDPPRSTGNVPLCSQSCQIPTCGNGAIDPGETCDPPNTSVCNSQCQSIPIVCGNGIVQPGESCEFPNDMFCQNCQWTSCGQCGSAVCRLGQACATLTGADEANCIALEGCLVPQQSCLASGPNLANCFCLPSGDCSNGVTGACVPQLEALAHASDLATLIQLMNDRTSIFTAIGTELICPLSNGCGLICSGVQQ